MLANFYNLHAVAGPLAIFLLSLFLIGCGSMLEWARPVRRLPDRAAIFNIAYMIVGFLIQGVISPLVLAVTAIVVGALGGAWWFSPRRVLVSFQPRSLISSPLIFLNIFSTVRSTPSRRSGLCTRSITAIRR